MTRLDHVQLNEIVDKLSVIENCPCAAHLIIEGTNRPLQGHHAVCGVIQCNREGNHELPQHFVNHVRAEAYAIAG